MHGARHGLHEVEARALARPAAGRPRARSAAAGRPGSLPIVARRAADLAQRPLLLRAASQRLARSPELLDQARASEGDGGLAGDRLEQGGVVGPEGVDLGRPDRDGAERTLVAVERRRDDAVDALGPDVGVGAVAVDEVRVLEVVAADVGLAGDDGAARRADLEAVVGVLGPLGLEDLLVARREQAPEQVHLRIDDVDPGAVAVEEAQRLVDRELDDGLGIAGARDPRAELAQRALDHRLALAGLARAVELLDQPRVGHRERRVLRRASGRARSGEP